MKKIIREAEEKLGLAEFEEFTDPERKGRTPGPKKKFSPGVVSTAITYLAAASLAGCGLTQKDMVAFLARLFPKKKGLATTAKLALWGYMPRNKKLNGVVSYKPTGNILKAKAERRDLFPAPPEDLDLSEMDDIMHYKISDLKAAANILQILVDTGGKHPPHREAIDLLIAYGGKNV